MPRVSVFLQISGVANGALERVMQVLESLDEEFPNQITAEAHNGCVRFNVAMHTEDVDVQAAILHKLLSAFSFPAMLLKCTIALPAGVLMVRKHAGQSTFTLTSMDQQQQPVITSAAWTSDTRTVLLHGHHLRGATIWACIPGSESVHYLPIINPTSEDMCLVDHGTKLGEHVLHHS